MMLGVTTITNVPIMVILVMAAITANLLLLPVVVVNAQQLAQSENIPNPETNGDITIQSGLYSDPQPSYVNPHFIFDLSTFQMWFSKENLSQFSVMNLPDEGVRPSFNLRPTSFDFNFYVQILEQELSGSTLTFLKEVRGSYNIYKIQDFPELNERHYYGRGITYVGNQTWFDSEALFMEKMNAPFSYGIYVRGETLTLILFTGFCQVLCFGNS